MINTIFGLKSKCCCNVEVVCTTSSNTVYYVIPQKGVSIPRPVAPATSGSRDVTAGSRDFIPRDVIVGSRDASVGSKERADTSVAIHIPGRIS